MLCVLLPQISQQDDAASNHPVVLASEKCGLTQLQQLNFDARQVCKRVEKRTASIFNLFRCNVARRVGGFRCLYYGALSSVLKN